MGFIRAKKLRGVTYYALVENRRENGKVRQRVIASLGRNGDLVDTMAIVTSWLKNRRSADEIEGPKKTKLSGKLGTIAQRRVAQRKLGFYSESGGWHGTYAKSGEIGKQYRTYTRDEVDARIDAYLMTKHEGKIGAYKRRTASLESRLQRMWDAIPEAERPEMESDVQAAREKHQREWDASIIRFAKSLRSIVPQSNSHAGRQIDSGATGVVPQMRGQRDICATTAEGGVR